LEKITHSAYAFAGLVRAAWIEYERDRARYLAVAMIYYAIVAMIPLFLLLLSALGLLLRFSAIAATAQQEILLRLEDNFGIQLRTTIERLLNTLKQESIVATVIGLVSLILAASVLFNHLRLSFRAIWKYEPPLVGPARAAMWATILERGIAFIMVLSGSALLLAALVLIAVTQWLNGVLNVLPVHGQTTGWLLGVLTSWIVAGLTFGLLFKFLPPLPIGWRDIWLAVLLCTSAWVVASEFLTFFGGFLAGDRRGFGALGGVLVVMLWMNIVSQLLFFGAEICKIVATQGRSREIRQEPKRRLA
jgi:membrane protein